MDRVEFTHVFFALVKMNICVVQINFFFLFQLETAHNWHLSMEVLNFVAKTNTEVLSLIFHKDFFPRLFFFLSLIYCNICRSLKKLQNHKSLPNSHTGKFKNYRD